MNKKILLSFTAAAVLSFTHIGAADAFASCGTTQKPVVVKCLNGYPSALNKDDCAIKFPQWDCIKPSLPSDENAEETPETNAPSVETVPESTPPATEENNGGTDDDSTVTDEVSAFEAEVVELTNAERAKQGLAPLTLDVELSKVARIKSEDMQANNYFSHTSPTYGSPFDMMKQFGITYSSAGENIAQGQQTPEEVVSAWMNSQGHRENIMNADFTHIGIGHTADGNYWTQMFIGK